MKNVLAYFPADSENPSRQVPQVHAAVGSLAKLLRRIGRRAMQVSFFMGIFASKVAHAKLGFMILLPCGLILIAIAGYLLKEVKLAKFRLTGREAELFAYVIGGCASIALIQVLVEKLVLHK